MGTGNDLTEDISPVQAGLKWTIGQRRRDACDFLGGEVSHQCCFVIMHLWQDAPHMLLTLSCMRLLRLAATSKVPEAVLHAHLSAAIIAAEGFATL